MTIGQLAEVAGVPTATVRYYERRGLLAPPRRTRSGYRDYVGDAARRVRFIRRAQDLGFTLEEVEELLLLRVSDASTCEQVAAKARAKASDIQTRLDELSRLEAVLLHLADACASRTPTDDCPVLAMLTEDQASDA